MAEPITHPEGGLLWEQPDWLTEAEAWIHAQVEHADVRVTGEIERVHLQWWSTVLRVPTTVGDLYFKAGASTQSFEPSLIALLARVRPGLVPHVVAAAPERGWMLMRDGGTRLRELIDSAQDLGRLEAVLPAYGELQLAVAPEAERALALGVPDMRLAGLPSRFAAVLDDQERLVDCPEGVTTEELGRLADSLPDVERMCEELGSFGVPETIQHDDLHDGNILIRDGHAVFFDWGDSCVSHPFHTLTVTLRGTAWRYELEPGGPGVVRLRDAYLEPFLGYGTRDEVVAISEIAYRTGTIGRALAWYRYLVARRDSASTDEADAVAYGLKLFLGNGPIGTWQ